ncbi:glycosyltransferase family 2 protein [Pseudomonas sp. N040]|uniref:glycosyltransferase family 2 protein n=1 Tax=Pseudomonas sp. N040 TaxID=2785325 RepID=UPI0018A2D201|nr:glycosyltransferase family 2 protein [Pseudomonas sp. N040]MBF7731161.1 glycosyltransferase family 2 protein [Pseudomonas sp. N040]MBW7014804.1 glycosyltransferase [Pseudomonas sp. N040]
MQQQSPVAVSIISPVFNSSRFLRETLESVKAQTREDWELICVDDGSSDDSAAVVESFAARDCRIRLIRLGQNSGAAVARNVGIDAARGRYIAFLDSDDLWLPHKLETQLEFMRHKQAAFSFTAYDRVDEYNYHLRRVDVPSRLTYEQMLTACYIGCLTAIYDTAHFGKQHMPLMRKRQDYGLWLQLLKKVDCAHGLQEVLARYRVRPHSLSAKKLGTARYTWRVYHELEGFGAWKSHYLFVRYMLCAVLRAKFPALACKLQALK